MKAIFKQSLEEVKLVMSTSRRKAFQIEGRASVKVLRHFFINYHFRILTLTPKTSKFPFSVRWFLPQT